MLYQKIINVLDNITNQHSKFRIQSSKNWVELNDDERKTQINNNQGKFKSTMLKSNVCDYSDSYILVNETMTFTRKRVDATARNQKK